MKTCAELFEELNELDEHQQIEAKKASEVGNSLLETISAYSNEPGLGGGYILLGVAECEDQSEKRYCVVGILKPEKILNDIITQCSNRFNHPVRPQCFTEQLEGKTVIGVFVHEEEPGNKPIFFKKVGLPQGAFRRIGSSDVKFTEDDLQLIYQEKNRRPYDQTVIPEATISDLDPDAIAEYRRLREENNPEAEELRLDNTGLLESLYCVLLVDGEYRPTVAGMLLFGKRAAIRRFFPMVRLDYIRISGTKWIEDPDNLFETLELQDPIFRLLPRGRRAILDDLPKKYSFVNGTMERVDEPRIPLRVIREALTNAVMHRNYQVHNPIQVILYSNRLEIHNPGYSLKPVDELGNPGSKPRNPTIASVLHDAREAETKGTGIRVMKQYMKKANLSSPSFKSDRDLNLFVATFLFHHFSDKEDLEWLAHFKDANLTDNEALILIYAREMGWVNNAICRDNTGLDTLGVSYILQKLRKLGLLEQHPHASATYYTPTRLLLHPEEPGTPDEEVKKTPHEIQSTLDASISEMRGSESLPAKLEGSETEQEGLPAKLEGEEAGKGLLPAKLEEAISNLGKRRSPAEVQAVIKSLCEIRPYTRAELGAILNRSPKYIFDDYLKPMLQNGVIELLYPDNIHNPNQAYRTVSRERRE